MSHGHSGHDSWKASKLHPASHSETDTIARGMTDVDVGSGALLGGMVRMQDRAPDTSDANFDQCWFRVQPVEFILVSP